VSLLDPEPVKGRIHITDQKATMAWF